MRPSRSQAWWAFLVSWLVLAVTVEPAVGEAVSDASGAVAAVARVGAAAIWMVVLVASLVPSTASLTVVRMLAPFSAAAAIVAVLAADDVSVAAAAVALVSSALATLLAFLPGVGAVHVQASAYGDEVRILLRPPPYAVLVAAALWIVMAVTAIGAALLLAAEEWAVGIVAAAVAVATAVVAVRACHQLSQRWLVFVPAGVVVHDRMALADPVLLRRAAVSSFGPALVGTTATDLTLGAPGLALEIRLSTPQPMVILDRTSARDRAPEGPAQPRVVDAVLVTPSRAAAAVAEATRRRFAVSVATTEA